MLCQAFPFDEDEAAFFPMVSSQTWRVPGRLSCKRGFRTVPQCSAKESIQAGWAELGREGQLGAGSANVGTKCGVGELIRVVFGCVWGCFLSVGGSGPYFGGTG
jgi:hypothetical protein